MRNKEIKSLTMKVGRIETADRREQERYYQGGGQRQAEPDNTPTGDTSWMGMSLAAGSSGGGRDWFGRERESTSTGVTVRSVASESPAEKAGIKSGDVILSINYQNINNINEFLKYVNENKNKTSFFIKLKRGNVVQFATIERNIPS